MNPPEKLNFKNRFIHLGEEFLQAKPPVQAHSPGLVHWNPAGADLIGLDTKASDSQKLAEYFCGNLPLPGAQPLAMAYSGYQFGSYNPQLGDGRGLLLGEVEGPDGSYDIHLKGAGQTRFCRGFDGRATFKSSIREYLGQEALHGLGIPTTRSLALVSIGELIYREQPEPAGIVARLAKTHVRFGSFDFFHYTNRPELVTRLADFAIESYFPEIANETDKYRLLYRQVVEKTAVMIAGWQSVGFGHGVMNTDNMSLLGETFDYGPYGFMDRFNPRYVCNRSDTHGRYAFNQQPEMARWNLFKLGETWQHLIPAEELQEELNRFPVIFNLEFNQKMARKLGLTVADSNFEGVLNEMFRLIAAHRPDYTNFFRKLARHRTTGMEELTEDFHQKPEQLDDWLKQYEALLDREDVDAETQQERMEQSNPKFILRNYLIQRAIDLALKEQDFSEIDRLFTLLKDPFNDPALEESGLNIDPEIYSADTPDPFLGMQVSCSA